MNALSSPVVKRTVNIAGHSTSVSLEQPFWDELVRIADERDISLSELISEIDEARGTNLSSALRLFVLMDLKNRT
ncbi:MAG: ribbon-helix-helix domain-containing protein [Alphaproteobacteria bacterium]|nr:ribbon-helix-helix domain-containing protein [Alphaproteobacteria bacterium]